MTGRYVERANEPVRAVADQVSARIASAMKDLPPAQVIQLKKGTKINNNTNYSRTSN
jgi:hypothetical protein